MTDLSNGGVQGGQFQHEAVGTVEIRMFRGMS
jgi:hypothetical protein